MLKNLTSAFTMEKLIQRFLCAWCLVNTFNLLVANISISQISYSFSLNLFWWALLFVVVFFTLSIFDMVFSGRAFTPWAFVLSFGVYAYSTLTKITDFWYSLSLIALTAIALSFLLKDDKLNLAKIKLKSTHTLIIVFACCFLIYVFIAAIGCLRYATYSSPNFDFGIWCNMFHYMKETFLPMVSSERDQILSHFAVHISPIYYVILPFYFLFPSPYTLQISQAAVIALGIIPLFLLARHKGLSNKFIALFSVAYAFSPVLICGIGYDMHENCFLVPLLLWMFYFFEKEKYPLMYIFGLGVCLIKEDAALFVVFFGIYLFFSRKKYLHGVLLAVLGAAYFGAAVMLINKFGDGVLTSRFDNYMYENEGLLGMVKIIITNPAYVFTQTLSQEKIVYLLKILLPMGFLPLATRRVSSYILLLPLMLINLMTTYTYQFNIDFQYSFGAAACLLYLAVINAPQLKGRTLRYMACLAAAASLILFCSTAGDRLAYLYDRYQSDQQEFAVLNDALESIPEEASVKASTFFVPHIADRKEIYEITSLNETDFAVFDLRPSLINETTQLREQYLAAGYTVELEADGYIVIMKNPNSQYQLER